MRNENRMAEALASPMEKINGARVKQLRENNNLTQLYLATAVGVTTDTVSRWENKRYPTIKRDNAEKLAAALGVSLAEILEEKDDRRVLAADPVARDDESDSAETHPSSPTRSEGLPPRKNPRAIIHACLVLLFLAVPIAWRVYSIQPPDQRITVQRLLPAHATVNQAFPVLLVVESTDIQGEPATFIVKEELPSGSEILQAVPHSANIDRDKNTIKWVGRATGSRLVFAYLARVGPTAVQPLGFAGSVTVKSGQGLDDRIAGRGAIQLGIHHWADTNRDNRIDDDEILAVYDTYDGIPGLSIEFEAIDSIWSAPGYRWDAVKGKIEVAR